MDVFTFQWIECCSSTRVLTTEHGNFNSREKRKEQVREDALEVEHSKPEEGKILLTSRLY